MKFKNIFVMLMIAVLIVMSAVAVTAVFPTVTISEPINGQLV